MYTVTYGSEKWTEVKSIRACSIGSDFLLNEAWMLSSTVSGPQWLQHHLALLDVSALMYVKSSF